MFEKAYISKRNPAVSRAAPVGADEGMAGARFEASRALEISLPGADRARSKHNLFSKGQSMKRIDIKLLFRKKDEALARKQEILDKAVEEGRGYTAEERARTNSFQREADSYSEQINEAQEIERQRAGIPEGQDLSGLRGGQPAELRPGVSMSLPTRRDRFFDTKTGKEVRSFLPTENWCEGREYSLPDGIRADELSIARVVRGLVSGNWKGAEAEQRTMAEGTGYLGGWLVPAPVADRIIQETRNQLRVSQAGALSLQMDAPELTLAKVSEVPTAHWTPENVAGTFSDLNFVPVKLTAKKLVAMTKLPEELVQDAANLERVLTDALAFALAKEIDLKALIGSGAGEPLGLSNTDGIGLTDMSSVGFDYDYFLDAIFGLVGKNVPIERIAALYNADVAKALAKLKETTTDAYLAAPEAFGTLRKLLTAQVETDKDTSTANAYLGDFADLVLGLRTELSLAISGQAADASGSAFTQTQIWFKTYTRVDSLVIKPASFHVLKDGGV